jgi:uncharacterized membrane protein YccC
MAGRPIYLLIFLMPSPRFELWILATYTLLVISNVWLQFTNVRILTLLRYSTVIYG